MGALFFLVPLAIALGAVFVVGFIWSVRQGQFDDIDDAPRRMLEDDD